MGLYKITQIILCLTILLAMVHASLAQYSPQDYLAAHNSARAQVGVGPLTWDNNLAAYAQNYANQRKGDCAMVHSDGPYGENLAAGIPDMTAEKAVKMWVDEGKFYDYNSNKCVGKECGHYKQVVWRNSRRVGCARVRCNIIGWAFVTCNYDPPGNIKGERPFGLITSF